MLTRHQRKARRQARLQLLAKQEQLEAQYCAACPVITRSTIEGCLDCTIYTRFGKIGEQLDELAQSVFVPPEELTYGVYLQLKERSWVDRDIADAYGISVSGLGEFKRSHVMAGRM